MRISVPGGKVNPAFRWLSRCDKSANVGRRMTTSRALAIMPRVMPNATAKPGRYCNASGPLHYLKCNTAAPMRTHHHARVSQSKGPPFTAHTRCGSSAGSTGQALIYIFAILRNFSDTFERGRHAFLIARSFTIER